MHGLVSHSSAGFLSVKVHRFDGLQRHENTDVLIEETPVALAWNSEHPLVMMVTPTDLEAFAIGFSITERIVDNFDQIHFIKIDHSECSVNISISIPEQMLHRAQARQRAFAGRSSCSLCGLRDLKTATYVSTVAKNTPRFDPAAITRAMSELAQWQSIGLHTGSAHAAGFATVDGQIIEAAEDVGRHNALDKLVGKLAARKINPVSGFLVITSRASFEMVQKATIAGFPMLCAISAPTERAARIAQAAGLTLVAFARGEKFACFAHPERLR